MGKYSYGGSKEIRSTGLRVREINEIIPVSVEQSRTLDNKEASNSIDLIFSTYSKSATASDGNAWLRLTLDQIYCVTRVIKFREDGTRLKVWECSEDEAECVCTDSLESNVCIQYPMVTTVFTTGTLPEELPSLPDCKYGDTVQLVRLGSHLKVPEIAVITMQG